MDPTRNAIHLAEHYLDVDQAQRALDALERAHPEDAALAAGLRARALLVLERYAEAADSARAGLAIEPEDPELLAQLAIALWKMGQLAEAERAVLGALDLEPDDPSLLCIYAHIVANAGQLEKAERLVERALQWAPDDPTVLQTQAEIAYLQGRDKVAERAVREALEVDPEAPHSQALLGVAAAERGDSRAAAAHLRRAAELDPSVEHFTETARALRVATHPLLIPMWPIERFGQGPVWIAGIATVLVAGRLAPSPFAELIILLWLVYVAYTWIAPPLVGRWVARRLP
jgi:Flp pilus assembly protein TadD